MSIIKPIKPIPEQNRRRRESGIQNKERQEFPTAELRIISAAVFGLLTLSLIAYFRVNEHSIRIAFVTDNALLFFTLLAIVFQAVIYRRQWGVMEGQLNKMKESLDAIREQSRIMDASLLETRNLVKHNEQAVVVAEKGIEVAQQNTEYAQRAYVSISRRSALQNGFTVRVENSGNTPAIGVSARIIATAGYVPPTIPDSLDCHISIGLLAPHSYFDIDVELRDDLSEKRDEFLGNDGFNYWCAGTIYYGDIFHQGQIDHLRVTNFCFYQELCKSPIQAWVDGNDAT